MSPVSGTRKEVNEVITDYVLEGGKVILETTGSDELHYSYDSRGQLVSFKLNGTPYFYTRNGQGDITGLIDASGAEVVKYTYDSWGKPISITGSLALTVGVKNPYRYRGYRYDTESGLYYLQSRYYDPSIKRFINADGLVDFRTLTSVNLYTYCANNPIRYSDESGFAFFDTMEVALQVGGLVMRALRLSIQCGKGLASGTLTMDDIMNDYTSYSKGNTNLEKVMSAKLFSSYKGIFVLIVDAPAAYSYGSTLYLRRNEDTNIIKHEYGHALQEQILGPVGYTFGIAAPSVGYNVYHTERKLPDNIYFSMPWEITADLFGGVKRSQGYYSSGAMEIGLIYFASILIIEEYLR
jgi:RHS repeat-associated protein